MIERKFFDCYNGADVYLYILKGEGIGVGITDFGAAVQYININTKDGVKDICLGYKNIAERVKSGTYSGATIGRVANRIADAHYCYNGSSYNLSANDGKNCNHGGVEGFDRRLFAAYIEGNALKLTYTSPDGDQGYPGNLSLEVEYRIVGTALEVRYTAVSDRDTLWAPTCHIYFNLNGEENGDVLNTLLKINAKAITIADKWHISTGQIADVKGTPFDFTDFKAIGQDIESGDEQITFGAGYDENFVLEGEHAATAYCVQSGIKVDIFCDLPGLQFYSGNFLNGCGKSRIYSPRDGFALEPQYFPNAINTQQFEKPILKANQKKHHYIRYEFTVK